MHLACSVKPTMSSGEHTLTKGKSELFANMAASAVLPAFGDPKNVIKTDNFKVLREIFTAHNSSANMTKMFCTRAARGHIS